VRASVPRSLKNKSLEINKTILTKAVLAAKRDILFKKLGFGLWRFGFFCDQVRK
jgi:hypothetical protein